MDYFHATVDKQSVRDSVFSVIESHKKSMWIDSVVVRKRKAGPSLRDPVKFYPMMMGYLLRYVMKNWVIGEAKQVIVVTDRLPVESKRKAIAKAIQTTLPEMLPPTMPYRILHSESRASYGLQIADYCNWAIYRRWSMKDMRSLDRIRSSVRSQFDIFRDGHVDWY